MTAMELNAEFFRAVSEIADDESLMKRLVKYAKKLAAKKEDDTLMTKEEFFARVDEAREQIKRGEYVRFSDPKAMNDWLYSL